MVGFRANILQNHTRMHSVKVQQTFNLSPFSSNALSILLTNLPPIYLSEEQPIPTNIYLLFRIETEAFNIYFLL